ncbi:MAG TPA: NMD3-related protein [Candidatus Nanoarchaeia archaeon]|nr:NMD3-related protein [Candidatus Nanoarchaeia archaeon]
MHRDYFEGILQLRGERIGEIQEVVEKYPQHIAKVMTVRNGYDYFFRSNPVMRSLVRAMQKRFGAVVKESPRLHTRDRQTGKAKYRLNILFRTLGYQTGDIIQAGTVLMKVTSITKMVTGVDIRTGKRLSFRRKGRECIPLLPFETRVIRVHPAVEVLDQDYQPVRAGSQRAVKLGEKVKVVCAGGFWLV